MACCETKLHWLLFVLLIAATPNYYLCVNGEPEVPCYFIFGDSLVDSGNNNNLQTSAKVNYPPYGIDFPDGPTGRFTNGRTSADIIGEMLGFDAYIPPYRTVTASQVLQGVNYASGSAGILDETGKHLGVNVELNRQLKNHQVIISRIVDLLGSKESAVTHLNKCLYSVVVGSNDYINNYFQPNNYPSSSKYDPQQYAEFLMKQYYQQIKILYNYGARMVGMTGIGPIGCTPNATATHSTGLSLCVDSMNDAANIFNNQLKLLVDKLGKDLPDAKFTYLSPFGIDILSEYPVVPGLKIKIDGCCQLNEYGQCTADKKPCLFRDLHLFWDGFHPSEIANRISGRLSYLTLKNNILKSSSTDSTPSYL